MSRDVLTVSLFPRPNVPVREPSPVEDVLTVCAIGLVAWLYVLIAIVLLL